MKKTFKALKLSCIFLLTAYSFIACDEEYSVIDSNVLGESNSNFNTANIDYSVIAYNKKLEALQINGLASTQLGFFDDPAFGTTTASIVTQVLPSTYDPDFDYNTVIDSVILKIPYYSSLTGELDENDYAAYSIDSLYGSSKIKLSIYQNNYFLRDFDPVLGIGNSQLYYSNAGNLNGMAENLAFTTDSEVNFDSNIGTLIYESTPATNENEDDHFTPSSKNIILTTFNDDGEVDTSTLLAPALRLSLDTAYWKTLIIDKEGDAVLSNENNFKNYFRGLYIKAESIDGDGNMVLLNLASTDANIVIHYSSNSTEDDDTTETQSTYTMSFSGNTVNPFVNNYNIETLVDGDNVSGDEKLYLKGASGSMAVVDLFGNEDLENIRDDFSYIDADDERIPTRLINEAILVVYEDDALTEPSEDYHTYDRLYAYDVNNNTTLIDYVFDPTDNTTTPFSSKFVHLGQRDTIGSDGGIGYKIRITEHIKNIIYNDSTNTKLGLTLSNNVNYTNNAEILNDGDFGVTQIPAASIITPRGTILYGSNNDDNRKMKLEIYYTEPNNN